MIEVFLFGIVLGLIPITLVGLFVTAYLFRELRRKLRAHIGHGLRTGMELYEIESPFVPQ